MTVRETIKEDKVGMRWIRTAATTLSSITAALLIIWGGLLWLVEPRLYEWAQELVDAATVDLRDDFIRSEQQIDKLEEVVDALNDNVSILTEDNKRRIAPSWRFDPVDTMISDGTIGGVVSITAVGYKLDDCGLPVVDLYFINGRETYHRFVDISILTDDGRGIALPVDPMRKQTLTYTARIPINDNVTPGRAKGYISVVYPDKCPGVAPAVAGPLQFRILG